MNFLLTYWVPKGIEAHLATALTSLAVSRNIEAKTGISIKQFVKIIRPIRSGAIIINGQEYRAKEIPYLWSKREGISDQILWIVLIILYESNKIRCRNIFIIPHPVR